MTGEKIIRKWYWVWEFEKEERWLNQMAEAGWLLEKVGFAKYYFVPCTPGSHIIRIEMREPDAGYIAFMQETGAEYVGRMAKWIFFRKKAEYGAFDIFSDIDSKAAHLNKISKLLSGVAAANLCIGLASSVISAHIGWINLLLATLLTYGLGRIHEKKEALERDRLLRE